MGDECIKDLLKKSSNILAELYFTGTVQKDLNFAREWCQLSCDLGHEPSHALMFDILWADSGFKSDHLLSQYVEKNPTNPELIDRKGRMYRSGRGVKRDLLKAADCFRYSAENGVKHAYNRLFDVLWKIDTPESKSEMIEFATRLAKLGDRDMMGRLGRAYRDGKGVDANKQNALLWLSRAVEKGLPWAEREYLELLNQ